MLTYQNTARLKGETERKSERERERNDTYLQGGEKAEGGDRVLPGHDTHKHTHGHTLICTIINTSVT